MIALTWNLKININDSIYKIETDSHRKQTHGYQGRKGGNKLGISD